MKELENIKELGTGKNLREYLLMPNGYSEFYLSNKDDLKYEYDNQNKDELWQMLPNY